MLIFAVVIVIFCCKGTKKLSNTQTFLVFFTENAKKISGAIRDGLQKKSYSHYYIYKV